MFEYLHNLWNRIKRPKPGLEAFPEIFERFQELLQNHQRVMELIADLGEKSGGEYIFDRKYLADTVEEMHTLLLHMVQGLNLITANRYLELHPALDRIFVPLESELRGRLSLSGEMPLIVSLAEAPLDRPELTGGKANNLAVIIQNLGLPVQASLSPPGPIAVFWSTTSWRRASMAGWSPGRRERWTSGRLPGRFHTACWPGWCPRKWPR